MTGLDAANSTSDIMSVANRMTNGLLIGGALIALWTIVFAGLLRRSTPAEASSAASLVCAVLSLVFAGVGWLSYAWSVGFGLVMILSMIALRNQN